ncbi:MAG TPA: sigma 54 modulation/S30EA ribosomal C-terminal domain-containing protein [Acidimicrobiales bacterium]|nr:sigma 54 modulation/S30EA ribosomal C-terminal domain-containing protein [Acidimicrobiales bacterium]
MRLSHHGVPECSVTEATEQLDVDVLPFVFHLDPATGRGSVVYRRFDGHYGCITPA